MTWRLPALNAGWRAAALAVSAVAVLPSIAQAQGSRVPTPGPFAALVPPAMPALPAPDGPFADLHRPRVAPTARLETARAGTLTGEAPATTKATPAPPAPPAPPNAPGGCPLDTPRAPLSLASALQRAWCRDPRSQQAWAQWEAADAQVRVERAAGWPSVTAQGVQGVGSARLRDADGATRARGRTASATLEASWVLLDFGQRSAQVEATQRAALAERASHDRMLLEVYLDTVSAYFSVAEARERVALGDRQIQHVMRVLARAGRPPENADPLTALQQRQIRTTLARLQGEQRLSEGAWLQARGELARRVGWPLSEAAALDVDALPPAPADLPSEVTASMNDALQAHPALRSAQARVAAAQAQVHVEQRAGRPTVTAVLSHQRGHDAFDARTRENAFGLQWQVPLYDGRSREHRTARARAEERLASAERQGTAEQLAFDAWSTHQALLTQGAALDESVRFQAQAEALLREERAAFDNGAGDVFDLIDAGEAVAEAGRQSAAARSTAHVLRLRLAAQLGRLSLTPF